MTRCCSVVIVISFVVVVAAIGLAWFEHLLHVASKFEGAHSENPLPRPGRTAVQRHVDFWSRAIPGKLTWEEIEYLHWQKGFGGLRTAAKAHVIDRLAHTDADIVVKGESEVDRLACVHNPAATGLWNSETGELDEARWAELYDLTSEVDGVHIVTYAMMQSLRGGAGPVPASRRFWLSSERRCVSLTEHLDRPNPVPELVDWTAVTSGSIDETFSPTNDKSQLWRQEEGHLAWSYDDLRAFYNDSAQMFHLIRGDGR